MIWLILVLIYLVSFVIHLLMEYRENKGCIHNIGDLIDNIHFYMWFPILNTLMILIVIITMVIMELWELLKLNVLWEKLDITLKKIIKRTKNL